MSVRQWYAHDNDNRRVNIGLTVLVAAALIAVIWLGLLFSGGLRSDVNRAASNGVPSLPPAMSSSPTSSAPATTSDTAASTTTDTATSTSTAPTTTAAPITTQPPVRTTAAPPPPPPAAQAPPPSPRIIETFQAVYCGWTKGSADMTLYFQGAPYSMNTAPSMAGDSLKPGSGQMSIGTTYQFQTTDNRTRTSEAIYRVAQLADAPTGTCDYPQQNG